MMGGKQVFAMVVHHPGFEAKRPVGQAVDELRDQIVADLQSVVTGGAN
jgi:hypothetical protein